MNDTAPAAVNTRGRIASALAMPITPRRLLVVFIACGLGTIGALEGLLLVGLDPYGAASLILAACLALLYGARRASLTGKRAGRRNAEAGPR